MNLVREFFLLSGLLTSTLAFVPSPSCSIATRNSILLFESLQPLATEGDWTAFLDEEGTGLVYYFNSKTGDSIWEPPTDTFPTVVLKGSMRRRAKNKQEEYIKAITQQELVEPKKGFLSSLLEGDEEDEPSTEQQSGKKKEEADWFSFIFEERLAKQAIDSEAGRKSGGFLNNIFGSRTTETTESAPVEIMNNNQASTAVIEEPLPKQTPLEVKMSAFVKPHPMKVSWGGEDAVFTQGRTFGVFDGVSGAEKKDGIPLYSKTMAEIMKDRVGDTGISVNDITKLMTDAAKTADQTSTGATTAIVGSIGEDGFLRVLNVGDSTCIIIRDGKVVGKSKEISHYFECPYQLSADSPDRPKDGTKFNFELLPGDMILTASDGVFDNLDPESVANLLTTGPKALSSIAKRVVEKSRKVSLDSKAATPYAKLAQKYGDPDFKNGLGGKVDDISCIVVSYGSSQ
jgi:protein phosphatase PTC7